MRLAVLAPNTGFESKKGPGVVGGQESRPRLEPRRSRLWVSAFGLCLLLLGSTSACSRGAYAAVSAESGGNVDSLVTRLQSHYQVTGSFSVKFTETVTRPGGQPVTRSGVIYYQKPGKLRWEFESPQPETIVSDGSTIFDYDPGLNQVVETPLHQAVKSQAAVAFLLGVGNLKRDFTAARAPQGNPDGLETVVLTPKDGGEKIEAGIDPKSYNIERLAMGDSMGNRTELSFSDIDLNLPLKASLFQFTPPSGADIVSAPGAQ